MAFWMTLIFTLFMVVPVFSETEISGQSLAPETEAAHEIKYDETMAEEEAGGSVSGVVVNVNPSSGTFSLRDTEDGEMYYLEIKGATTYAGISSLSDINPGDAISVDCYGPEGHLIADTITLQGRTYPQSPPQKLQKVLSD